ncbi:CBS domain-containing protein [Micromonospora sp. WMMD1102]|uniref:CBS domain-containing protein n=1 Tax=Micromonospora sp. WMMD1102 TaxID=3016105 RepID=UPI0024154B61|nr:CBS domain-containing protein [Micromonospora sp. WMMD1102]MDG4787261.1 CBS domain-containing protein [Micromonospora sp. WMMD1102]
MRQWLVQDVMTTDVVTVGVETPYRAIVGLLAERGVSGVPVVDESGRVQGVVSESDLLAKVELTGQPEPRLFVGRRQRAARTHATASVAEQLMTAPPITVVGTTTLTTAAKLMEAERVKRLPVVDELGRLVGIVCRGDLLRVYLRPDADIRADVVDDVLRRVLAIEEGVIRVAVQDGVVTLDGRLDRRSTAQIAVRLAYAVPGVVDVTDRLEYAYDDVQVTIGMIA